MNSYFRHYPRVLYASTHSAGHVDQGLASCVAGSTMIETVQGPVRARDLNPDIHSVMTMRPMGASIENPVAWVIPTRGPGVHIETSSGASVRLTDGHVVPLGEPTTVDCPRETHLYRAGAASSVPRTEQRVVRARDVRIGDVLTGGDVVTSVTPILGIDAVRIWLAEAGYLRTTDGIVIGTRHHERMQVAIEYDGDPEVSDIVAIEHTVYARGHQQSEVVWTTQVAYEHTPEHATLRWLEYCTRYRSGAIWVAGGTEQLMLEDVADREWEVGGPHVQPDRIRPATLGDPRSLRCSLDMSRCRTVRTTIEVVHPRCVAAVA